MHIDFNKGTQHSFKVLKLKIFFLNIKNVNYFIKSIQNVLIVMEMGQSVIQLPHVHEILAHILYRRPDLGHLPTKRLKAAAANKENV